MRRVLALAAAALLAHAAQAAPAADPVGDAIARFQAGLAQRDCSGTARWTARYAPDARRLLRDRESSRLFAHVVDSLHRARLPTQYAVIPLIESGYRADARSQAGPAGLWQLVAPTARRLRLPVHAGYDGRLSAEASTRAAVKYLARLHRLFDGDWRRTVMAYNAGEGRIRSAGGNTARIPAATRRYAQKVEALSCLLQRGDGARLAPEDAR